jgi:hypothetical protein
MAQRPGRTRSIDAGVLARVGRIRAQLVRLARRAPIHGLDRRRDRNRFSISSTRLEVSMALWEWAFLGAAIGIDLGVFLYIYFGGK